MCDGGTAVTGCAAPVLLVVMDVQQVAWIYAGLRLATAVAYFVLAERVPVARDAKPASLLERMAPLRNLPVWRFSLYYFLVFGGFIALASWLPRYYMGVSGVDLSSEERRVGKECVRTCRSRWWADTSQNKKNHNAKEHKKKTIK